MPHKRKIFQSDINQKPDIKPLFLALVINLLLYTSYFFFQVRNQAAVLIERQSALEKIKALAVPGSDFLKQMDTWFLFQSSLFFVILLGVLFIAFLCMSLIIRFPMVRGLFLLTGFIAVVILTRNDRTWVSFSVMVFTSFTAFYFLTLHHTISFSVKEIALVLILAGMVSASLMFGARHGLFLKTRDKFFLDSSLGSRIAAFYYTYSPLAVSLISPPAGIYEGLIFQEGIKKEPFVYYGHGLFLTGNEKIRNSADFIVQGKEKNYAIRDRYDNTIDIGSLEAREVKKAVRQMFTMQGLLKLNTISLYAFPAGLLIIVLFFIKLFFYDSRAFVFTSVLITLPFLVFIWYVSLTGNDPPPAGDIDVDRIEKIGLSVAYHLHGQKKIHEQYKPIVTKMARADSVALRYWGARLMGRLDDRGKVGLLLRLMNDPSLNVRYASALSLFDLLGKDSLKPLSVRMLSDPNWYVRCTIFTVFLKIGAIPRSV